jgi:hypothetical protein
MSYEKFKKLRSGTTVVAKIENPYTKTAKSKYEIPAIDTDDLGDFELSNSEKDKVLMTTSILNGQNKYLLGLVANQAREIKELREDIASLYAMLMVPESKGELTPQETREVYSAFKEDERHLLNRKIKKHNGSGIEGE